MRDDVGSVSVPPCNYDDLPVLEELGRDLSAAFLREERAAAARRGRRRLRRIAAATAALFVIVPGAVATRSIWAPDPSEHAPGRPFTGAKAVQLAEGRGDVLNWRLSAYSGADGPCWQFHAFTATASTGVSVSCLKDLPPGLEIAVGTGGGFGETYVEGWASERVSRVEVVDNGVRTPARMIEPTREQRERGGLPGGLKFYVATLPGEFEILRPLGVVAFDSSGRVVERIAPPRGRPKR